jgi:hypothetical protein
MQSTDSALVVVVDTALRLEAIPTDWCQAQLLGRLEFLDAASGDTSLGSAR